MLRRRLLPLVLLPVLLAGGAVWLAGRPSGQATAAQTDAAAPPGPAVPVSVTTVQRRDLPLYLEAIGNVQAFNTVLVRSQVDGQLTKIAFHEGQDVHAGDLLAQIDPRSFQATLDQALAKRAQDTAQLANARLDVQRYSTLVQQEFISRQQLDTAKAQVGQLAAVVQGDEAAIENARVQLGYTAIHSPIDGRAGIRQIDAGNIVHANDTSGLVVITQLHPISVLFTLPEDSVTRILEAMAGSSLEVITASRDGKQKLDEGRLELLDNQIDQTTGMVRLKATMPNRQGTLWPGQFVTTRLLIETRHQALSIPFTAVVRGQQGSFAWVVKEDGTVDMRPVTLGPTSGDLVIVDDGLKDGERVVIAGQYRLKQGVVVQIDSGSTAATAPAPPQRPSTENQAGGEHR